VIGNTAYRVAPLASAVGGARLIAETLSGLGFEVLERQDLDRAAMRRAIKAFGDRLARAGADAVGLFFYAGHGVKMHGHSYLIPVRAEIRDETDVDIEAVSVGAVLETMALARSRFNFLILDACRDNPYARSVRPATPGRRRLAAPSGTLVAYSTAPGDVAEGGSGCNSTYTQALVEAMRQPGLSAEHVFKRVRVAVMVASAQRQVPWEESSLTESFYFNPASASD
jgi:uncharacterized caspase-like protein